MSKHAATPTTDTIETERFAAQMAQTYGRKTPLPGPGRRRYNPFEVQA